MLQLQPMLQVDDEASFQAAWARMGGGEVLTQPHMNERAHHEEFSVRTSDGYVVVVHTPATFG